VFAGLDFTMLSGDLLVLTGPNGSGKSSLLRVLAGLLRPESGDISWNGAPIAGGPEAHRARLHYVGHGNAVKAVLTVAENLEFSSGLRGRKPVPGALENALEIFGIGHLAALPVQYLSAGQRRRLALARLLVSPTELWLLDEPETSLDAASARALDGAIAAHCGGGGMAVITTHDAQVKAGKELDLSAFAGAPAVTGAAA
jgi:heme exporter protein A